MYFLLMQVVSKGAFILRRRRWASNDVIQVRLFNT